MFRYIEILSLIGIMAIGSTGSASESIKSDCSPSEIKILRNQAIIDQISPDAQPAHEDCTVLHDAKNAKLLVLYVLNATGGVEVHLGLFSRHNLSSKSSVLYKSESLGFEAFPLVVNGQHRLLFVTSSAGAKKIDLYANLQSTPRGSELVMRELDLTDLSLSEVKNTWNIGAGKVPKILKESGKWRAIVSGKLVDL